MVTTGSVFVGRQREMAELKAALQEAIAGHGRVLMLMGEPGAGKTRTSEELAALAQQLGAAVLWGRCPEEGGAPPYWPWTQAIRAYAVNLEPQALQAEMGAGAADIAQLVPEIKEQLPGLTPLPALDDPEQARFRLFNSITAFLKRASRTQPLLLVLDNLHWADPSSLRLLEFVAQELAGARLLLLGTYRDTDVSRGHPLFRTLGELTRQRLYQRVLLRGLSRDEVGQVIAATGSITPPSELVTMVHQRTEGNPLFVGEVVRLLAQEGLLAAERLDDLKNWDFRLPEGVREVIGRRLDRLSAGCNQVLNLASVIGIEFSLGLLGPLSTDQTEEQVLQALEEALDAGVIQEISSAGEGYQFSHALIQQTLASELSAARRVRLHVRIAQALEGLYGPAAEDHAAELARHFAQAEPVLGPEKVVKYALLAGDKALASYGWEEAIGHFQAALELMEAQEADPRQRAEVLEKLGLATGLGRGRGAVEYWEKALSLYEALQDNKRAGQVHLRLGSRWGWVVGRGRRYAHSVKAVALLEPGGASPQLAHAYLQLGDHAVHGHGERATGIPLMEKGLALAEQLGDAAVVIEVTWRLGHGLVIHEAKIDQGLKMYARGVEAARRMGNPVTLSEAAESLSREHAYLRDAENALRWAGQAVESARQAGSVRFQTRAALALAWACILRGDAVQAYSSLEAAEQVARKAGVEIRAMGFGVAGYVIIPDTVNIVLGEWDKAESGLLQALEFAEQADPVPSKQIWVNPALGWLYLEMGNLAAAKTHLGESATHCQAAGDKPPELYARALLVQVACQAGDLTEAAGHLGRAREIFSLSPDWRGLAAEVHHAEGIVAAAQRHWPEAEAAFQRAVEINRQYHLPYFQARSLLEWGEMHLSRNAAADRQKGMQLLDQALAIFQRVQAKKMVEKVLARQQRIDSPPPAAPALPGGLTQRELEVLRLIALGRSNREIAQELVISLNTVGHHVSNILSKTGIPSRAGVGTYAARHGLLA